MSVYRIKEVDGENVRYDERFVGCVLYTFEKNGYDDSDYFAACWNGERIENVMFDTTRGCTMMGAFVDATDEVRELAKAYEVRCKRKRKAHAIKLQRKEWFDVSKKADVPFLGIKRLFKVMGQRDGQVCLDLINATRTRNKFRKSIREQIINWCKGESEFPAPLTWRQMNAI